MEGLKPPSWLRFRQSSASSAVHAATRNRLITTIATTTLLLALITFAIIATPRGWKTASSRGSIAGFHPYTGRPDPSLWKSPHPKNPPSGWAPAERLIVKVKLEDEDVSWLDSIQWIWRHETVTIPNMYTNAHPLSHRPDKGRIASAYLTWIIENYNHLPETLVMLPPEDTAPLADSSSSSSSINPPNANPDLKSSIPPPPPFDIPHALKHLQTPFIQSTGFSALQCPSHKSLSTCNSKALLPTHPPPSLRTLEAHIPAVWKDLFGPDAQAPERIAAVLGAQFAVSREAIRKRSLQDYLRYWEWVNRTIMDDDSAGLVFEYVWHVVFGMQAVFCPERGRCECELYGRC